jgi:diaminopimelate epimerase
MRFAKGHGTENDFVIFADPDASLELTPGLAARLCDRRAGIGADGVLRAVRTAALPAGRAGDAAAARNGGARAGAAPAGEAVPGPEWFMDYRNADGSVAEMCGNGIRVFARYLAVHGLVEGTEFEVATRSGPRLVRLAGGGVTVDMGPVAVLGEGQAVIGGKTVTGLRVTVGNPHLACLVDTDLGVFGLAEPPVLDPGQFPRGANVELVRVTGEDAAAMRVHERGSGETRSCGTGAVAAAVAAARSQGHRTGRWRIAVPGGQLTVDLDGVTSWLTGPAVIVAEGDLDRAWLAAEAPPAARPLTAVPA